MRDCRTCSRDNAPMGLGNGWVICPRCGGSKKIQGETCYHCRGAGRVICPACGGSGKQED